MEKGESIKDWIKAGEIAKKFKREAFFGIGIQAGVDNGSFFVVVFNKSDNTAIKGGLKATKKDIDTLKELGITITDKGGWLEK